MCKTVNVSISPLKWTYISTTTAKKYVLKFWIQSMRRRFFLSISDSWLKALKVRNSLLRSREVFLSHKAAFTPTKGVDHDICWTGVQRCHIHCKRQAILYCEHWCFYSDSPWMRKNARWKALVLFTILLSDVSRHKGDKMSL